MTAAFVIGGLFLLGMVVMAGYAARTLPSSARVPLNPGVVEYSVWLSKPAGLAAWLGVGVVAFAVFGALTLAGLFAKGALSVQVVMLPCVMMVVLAGQVGAFIVARRNEADAAAAAAQAEPAATAAQAAFTAADDARPAAAEGAPAPDGAAADSQPAEP